MGIRAAWYACKRMPEYVEHKHEDCTPEKAMEIFATEQKTQAAKQEKTYWFDKSPAELKQWHGIDSEAIIIGTLCIGFTVSAAMW
jgi:hypothetical protein